MIKIFKILKEVLSNMQLAWLVARSNKKALFKEHRFGIVWEYLNPLIQIGMWGLVFGVIRGRGGVEVGRNSVPFIPWMLVGMTAWGFMNGGVKRGGVSVLKKKTSLLKVEHPLSVLPLISIFNKLSTYFVLLFFTLLILFVTGFMPTLYWLKFSYYFIAMLIFVYFFALLNSTIILVFPDYENILNPIMRLFFFFSGPIWRIHGIDGIPSWFIRLMDLTPFSYIITGFRHVFFGDGFFREGWLITTAAFWLVVLFIAIIASHCHLKMREKFIKPM